MPQAYSGFKEQECRFDVLHPKDLSQMMAIELGGHAYPWTESVFTDCFKPGYQLWGIWAADELAGFAVLVWQYDELHLLNLCIRRIYHRTGLGRRLLRFSIARAWKESAQRILLEVRVSNRAAIQLYRTEGFCEIGRRKNYYPAAHGREDALVMALACNQGAGTAP